MATLWRILGRGRPGIQFLLTKHGNKCTLYRHIATSKNNKDMPTATAMPEAAKTQELKDLEEHFADADPDKMKNWVSLGWSNIDRDGDEFTHNFMMFIMYTIVLCGGFFVIWTLPDLKNLDWALREAYFDMDKREKSGQPLIDPYLVPPEQVTLPPEEEIDVEIVI